MDNFLNLVSSPWVMGVIGFGLGFFLKEKKSKAILKLISLLIDAIEIVDKEIHDVVNDEQQKKLTKIKAWIAGRVGITSTERAVLDGMLDKKGMLSRNSLQRACGGR